MRPCSAGVPILGRVWGVRGHPIKQIQIPSDDPIKISDVGRPISDVGRPTSNVGRPTSNVG